MKPKLFILLFCSLILTALKSRAQTPVPFDSPRWTIKADSAVREEYLGRPCLKLVNGTALLKDAHFTNGIIEFKIAMEQARYFPGIRFRVQDEGNGESYYLRPHQSGNPDAMQYCPEYNGAGSWQLYYGQGFNNAHKLPFGRWLSIRILVKDARAEVYFDDEKDPVLYIHKLKRPLAAGMISLNNGGPVPARYADFSYTPTNNVQLMNSPVPEPILPATVFTSWQVSRPFDEKIILDRSSLDSPGRAPLHPLNSAPRHNPDTSSFQWHTLPADERGVADLSILAGAVPGKNTVFVRQIIESDRMQIKKFSFGFSDRARVYLNWKLLYSGEDEFLSRDYRFLGTMGYFDELYLDLKKGRNELWMAISEDMGGWGVQGRLEDWP
jgi:hypothetical protein